MSDILASFNPALILILTGIVCAFLPSNRLRKLLVIAAPIVALYAITSTFFGQTENLFTAGKISFAGLELTTLRIDYLSIIWGMIFCVAGVFNGIYGLHERSRMTDTMALLYTGGGIGAVFAGDLITLFMFWELLALSSVFIVWAGGRKAYKPGMRYLGFHVLSGVLLLAGTVIYGRATGNYEFNHIGLEAPGGLFLLAAMGIKAGFPVVHTWIQDAYPKSSVTGTVILSVFTTKVAIYALARGFAGEEVLIYIGAFMMAFPVFFAVLENDLRKVLSYSLNNQLGFMVCGIGIGTNLALNGVAAHVVVDILFKGLLFMSMGAVLHRVGTAKASELGGLFRSMPYTTVLCLIGAGSISAFPMMGAFISKSMILSAALEEHYYAVFAVLLFASAGVLEHSGIKVPFFAFFAHDSKKRCDEAPWNMLVAMGIAAFLCLYFAFPWGGYQHLYAILPYEFGGKPYEPYTGDHVVYQMQLLMAAILAFNVLCKLGLYPPERRAQILDIDWFWRKPGLAIVKWINAMWARLGALTNLMWRRLFRNVGNTFYSVFSPAGALSEDAPSGIAAVLIAVLLAVTLLIVYFF